MALPESALPAQERTDFIFHVYVDPIYGDNVAAMAQNPGTGGPIPPLGLHPDVDFGPPVVRAVQGRLFHAPYAFRSVNAPGAAPSAQAYINAAFPVLPAVFGNFTVEKVVIHCLPGIYGPVLGTPIDAATGLPWNAEVFPITLRSGVSIRGTSALDVIFDARGQTTTIFDVPTTVTFPAQHHTQDFINGVTIRNARSIAASPFGVGAGVFVRGIEQNQRTISNCFIVGNTVGIAVASDLAPQEPKEVVHQVNIINNTIAWNAIGIWNGDATLVNPPVENEVRVFNNIFDASPPNAVQYPAPVSCFEGLSSQQMLVVNVTNSTGTLTIPVNSNVNAWPIGSQGGFIHDLGLGTANWPAVTVFGGNRPTSNRYDLDPFIGQGILRPSATVLYVNDALRVTTSSDYSRNDFRLAPRAVNGFGQGISNPLVDLGIALPPSATGYVRLNMGKGPAITLPPGPSSIGDVIDPPATVHCWDWDAEGFGNVRIASRTGFTAGGFLASLQIPEIDLGADEMGELIMAGYIDGTRIFSHNVPGDPAIPDHTRVYFLDLPSATYTRPQGNLLLGGLEAPSIYYQWWTHVQTPVNAALSANFTRGNPAPISARFDLTTPPPFAAPHQDRPVFMRNLVCDVSPHLIEDLHPLWSYFWGSVLNQPPFFPTPLFRDVYASHAWYDGLFIPAQGGVPPIHWGTWDNPFLFYNPSRPPYTASRLIWTYIQFHNVTVGITSPPGSFYYSGASPPYNTPPPPANPPTYLLAFLSTSQFGPFGACTPVTSGTYSTNALGVGDAGPGCPDEMPIFPGLDGIGHRYNCQRGSGSVPSGNLQSFLVVTTLSENPIDMVARSGRERQRGDTGAVLEKSSLRQAADYARTRR